MMTVWNLQSNVEIFDLLQHVIGVVWMFLNDHPLIRIQRTFLMQDRVWDAHLANVMEECSSTDVYKSFCVDSHRLRQTDCKCCNPLRMSFGLFIPQLECLRPSFQSLIV